MGLNLKEIFKKDEETLVVDRKKQALKALIIFTSILFVVLVALIIVTNMGDTNEIRRLNITKDIQNVRQYVMNKATELKEEPSTVLPGTSLQETPMTLNINGVVEEYRYGYYLLNPEDFSDMTTALNLNTEQYIVNYDTYDVVNVAGIKYKRRIYHSIDDLIAIENNKLIPSENTIIIKVPNDMQYLHQYPNANFKLAGNIDMTMYATGEGWKPVAEFKGKLDGRGYTISNLTINRPSEQYVGLFGKVTAEAQIVNLTFENVHVIGENYTGVLAGTMSGNVNRVIVKPVFVEKRDEGKIIPVAEVKGEMYVGGLVGAHQQGRITNCSVDLISVSGREEVGGFVGRFNFGTIQECKADCDNIYALNSGGGFAGVISANETTYLNESVAISSIAGTNSLGGLIGKIEMLSATKLEVTNCYSKGTVSEGETNMGGLVGYVRTSSGASINFEALYTSVSILNKLATSGGCVGASNISISSPCSVSDVFWEKNLAPGEVLNGVGTTVATTTKLNFTDKTVNEMRIRTTFANWNFDVWGINERVDTPYLKFENNF